MACAPVIMPAELPFNVSSLLLLLLRSTSSSALLLKPVRVTSLRLSKSYSSLTLYLDMAVFTASRRQDDGQEQIWCILLDVFDSDARRRYEAGVSSSGRLHRRRTRSCDDSETTIRIICEYNRCANLHYAKETNIYCKYLLAKYIYWVEVKKKKIVRLVSNSEQFLLLFSFAIETFEFLV